ncbi:MAG: hypothetical protein ACI9MR_001721 [Myxococcota bacterium]|jgi:hypothetical protein
MLQIPGIFFDVYTNTWNPNAPNCWQQYADAMAPYMDDVIGFYLLDEHTQDSVLVGLLREHLDTFVEQAPGLPVFVERQMRAMIDCGDLTQGFTRLECIECRSPRIVPFSCKSRVCPSCAGRRMSEQAAHFVDRVLPRGQEDPTEEKKTRPKVEDPTEGH